MEQFQLEVKTEDGRMENSEKLRKNRNIFRKGLLFFLIVLFIGFSYTMGLNKGRSESGSKANNTALESAVITNKDGNNQVDFSLFWKVWNIIKEKHINRNNLDAQKMVYGAISGMLKATGDPYTSFFDPESNKSFTEELGGSFDGIGAELDIKDNVLTVVAPLEGSPAQKAGLRSGDKILKIGDKIISDMTIDEAIALIRGKKGTDVTLTILPNGGSDTKDVTITRDTIEVKTVTLEMKDDGTAYIKLNKFGENTDKEFDDAIRQLLAKKAKRIVLDLRNDPGGLLDKAVLVASRMIPKGKVVLMQEDSYGKRESLYTVGGDELSSIPTVVLINEGSASASEILAGALHDDLGTTLVGAKSFGKGSVQELEDLGGGSSVKVTIAKWLTPNGDYIMEKGINPDVEVKMTNDDYANNKDPQLDKALELVKQK